MSRWSESRDVYDDVCYLRQAHLFQKYGLGGIDTNIVFDEDDYQEQAEGDRLCGMERCGAGPLPNLDSGRRQICDAVSAEHVDVTPPGLNPTVLLSYLVDVQFTLLAISVAWTAWLWRFDRDRARQSPSWSP